MPLLNPFSMRRLPQVVLIVTTAETAWLMMQIVHELGHVLLAWLTSGEIARIVLHPLEISRTDLRTNPSPLIVCWGGPMFGAIAPLIPWAATHWRRWACEYWLKFFAGFCLIANGAYLAVGVREGIGDAGDLMRYGSPAWMLYGFGAVTIPAGLYLWNGLGMHFGLGINGQPISWRSANVCMAVLALTIIAEVVFASV